MAQRVADFIRVPTGPSGFQTMPVQPEKRLPESDISIRLCDESDAEDIAKGLYLCFPAAWWDRKEFPSKRPPQHIRVQRLAKRLLPTFSEPHMRWVKAVLTSTGEMVGVAGWMAPSNPTIHNMFRRDAVEFYGWQERMGWTDAEIEEMWEHVDYAGWNDSPIEEDVLRKEILGDEPHWHLAPLLTWPEYQGRGVGKRLMYWAIDQADKTEPVTPLYLESAPTARAVYMHCGFVPMGAVNFLRRGPAIVKGLEEEPVEESKESLEGKPIGLDVAAVAMEIEANLAS